VNGQDSKAEIFDVFLCHNSEDKPAVREISKELVKGGIKPWLDEADIRAGMSWLTTIGQQIETVRSAAIFVGQHGFGPWQNRETIAFLDESDRRGCPVILVLLSSAPAKTVLPWWLKELHYVDFRATDSHPLKRLIWGITGEKPMELSNAPASEKPASIQGAFKGDLLPNRGNRAPASSEARLYPPLDEPPDREQATQLEILRRRVMEYWVDGVLSESLKNQPQISLPKRKIDKAIDAPWKYPVQSLDLISPAPLDDRDLNAIYDATGLLLILGEPGSGKTTTLLDLARTLLDRAEDDIKERVPVVLNLSSWKKKQPLTEWIPAELSEKYRVPRKIGKSLLQNNYLLPLLDGLDEVETTLQPDCVASINTFIDEMNPPGLVVCCRLNEYRWLPERLKLNGAIHLEPLSHDEVGKYFDRGGPELAALREAVNGDPALQELAQTPLMLSIMVLTSKGAGAQQLLAQKGDSPEERRKQIFRLYVEQMFQRRGTMPPFPKEKTITWLSWLAGKMKEHSESVFLVEDLQPSWLGTRVERLGYGTVVSLSVGLIMGLIFGLIFGLAHGLRIGLIFGLSSLTCTAAFSPGLPRWGRLALVTTSSIGVLTGWLIGGFPGLWAAAAGNSFASLIIPLNYIILVEDMSWRWDQFLKCWVIGSIDAATIVLAVTMSLIFGLAGGLIAGPMAGLLTGLAPLLGGWLWLGLVVGFTDTIRLGSAFPNQGIRLSWENFSAVLLVSLFTIGLSMWLIGGLIFGLGSYDRLMYGLMCGLIFGLMAGLNRGGSAVIKHYALRLILWLKGYTPFKFVKFLDHCARLIILKKVGGGYIFIHRMLLEYFADLPTTEKSGRAKRG
jgi:hypothetical protein